MPTDTPAPTPALPPARKRSRMGAVVLLAACTAGGAYAGMRWHTTLEHWLVPASADQAMTSGHASADPATPEPAPPNGKKQLWTCGMHPQVIQDHPGNCPICGMKLTPLHGGDSAGAHAPGAAITIEPAVVQNMGIRTAVVTQGPLEQTVRATAEVVEPESARVDINLRVSGWVQKLYANIQGMTVHQGQPLFDLYSPDLQLAIEELITARRAGAAPEANDDHRTLADMRQALVAAAELRLQTLGLTAEQIAKLGALEHAPPVVTFTSPIAGIVVEKGEVNTGSAVMSGQTVLRLADRSTMWVEARVLEGLAQSIRVGQHAGVRVNGLAQTPYAGQVIFIHPNLDEMTRTTLVRIAVANPDGQLRAGMYGVMDIDVGSPAPVTQVPREAVLDTGEFQLVFMSLGRGRFAPRRVTLGAAGPKGMVQVLTGLEPGETVVASGQFLLDAESRRQEAIAKFLDAGTIGATPGEPVSSAPMPPPMSSPPTGAPLMAAASATISPPMPDSPAPSEPMPPMSSPPAPVASDMATPAPSPAPTTTQMPTGPAHHMTAAAPPVQAPMDAVVTAYLALEQSLGAEQTSDQPLPMAALLTALHGLHDSAMGDADTPTGKLLADTLQAAQALDGQPLDQQRRLFKTLSAKVIALAETIPPSSKVADSLFVVYCPMSKATWLQRGQTIANPFFATDMKDCGTVQRRLGDKTAAPERGAP